MAECNWCKKDMNKVDSCTGNTSVDYPDGKKLKPSLEHFDETDGRCHDCNVRHGEAHHPGCDAERCPNCGGQLISCGCLDEEEKG